MPTVEMTDEQHATWIKDQEPKTVTGPSVHVVFLLDRSGSMQMMHSDVVGGFNTFLDDQKAQDGDCSLTLAQFDSQGYDVLHDAVDLALVPHMRPDDFKPRGGTPLLDAIGRAITDNSARLEKLKNPNETQLVVILTDGHENQSHEYTRAAIKKLIADRESKGWTFAYLGCDVDAYADAGAMGFAAGSTQTYAPGAQGMAAAMHTVSANTANLRSVAYAGGIVDTHNFYVDRSAEEDAKRQAKNKGGKSH